MRSLDTAARSSRLARIDGPSDAGVRFGGASPTDQIAGPEPET
jgi:hypothetical protein